VGLQPSPNASCLWNRVANIICVYSFLLRWCIKYYKDSQANMDELDVSTILNPPRTIISTWMSRSSIPTTQDLCFSPMSKQGKRHEHTIEMVITVGFCQPGRFQNRFSRCQPGRRWHHVTAGAWCFTGSNLSSNQLLLRESNPPPHHTFGSWGEKKTMAGQHWVHQNWDMSALAEL